MIDKIFHHPYHYCAAVIARLAVCGATLIWALVVMVEQDALAQTRYGAPLTSVVGENWLAGIFGVLSVAMIWRIFNPSPPNPWGVLAYLAMALLWIYADVMILAARPWQPTAIAWCTVGSVLAAFALVANPRQTRCAPGP